MLDLLRQPRRRGSLGERALGARTSRPIPSQRGDAARAVTLHFERGAVGRFVTIAGRCRSAVWDFTVVAPGDVSLLLELGPSDLQGDGVQEELDSVVDSGARAHP
jgi:hypothetical protein